MADLAAIAHRHGVSEGAVRALQDALRQGGGRQAQFSHPELGGMGQWSAGGMTQVGDMFNTALKAKVAALCTELAGDLGSEPAAAAAEKESWWPGELGQPSASGAQNGLRYATFPAKRRVAVEQGGAVTLYDSGDHRIGGVQQQQGAGQDLAFTSQNGTVRAADLPVVAQR